MCSVQARAGFSSAKVVARPTGRGLGICWHCRLGKRPDGPTSIIGSSTAVMFMSWSQESRQDPRCTLGKHNFRGITVLVTGSASIQREGERMKSLISLLALRLLVQPVSAVGQATGGCDSTSGDVKTYLQTR